MTRPRPRIGRLLGLSFRARRWLLSGERKGPLPEIRPILTHEFHLEPFWRDHADAVVAHFALRHPGTRPRLWWRYDAPEPRQRLGDSSIESEAAYLRRNKLFQRGERQRLRPRDSIPEAVDAGV
jgi:hypothetical protein